MAGSTQRSRHALPAPSALLARWRALALLESLILPIEPARPRNNFYPVTLHADGRVSCVYNSFDPRGGYAWLCTDGHRSLYCGANCAAGCYRQLGPEIERLARASAKDLLPKAVTGLLPRSHRDSYGWTFAFWASGPDQPCIDLTGRDSGRGETARFRLSSLMYGSSKRALGVFRAEWERTDADDAVIAVLSGAPVSEQTARSLMPRFDWEAAERESRRLGYGIVESTSDAADQPERPL